jgi:pimeloyl-ACP methyl ester carboxylesterase
LGHREPATPDRPALPTLPSLPAVETHELVVGGLHRRLLASGAGPPLLLLHGIAGSADEYVDVLPRLGSRYRVYAPDAPGHGHSARPRDYAYDVAAYVEATVGVMDALGLRSVPVVAVSGGGTVALSLALEQAERVERLVLVDAAGLGSGVSWSYRLASLPLSRYAMHLASRRSIEAFGRSLLYDPTKLPEGWVERRRRIWRTPGAIEAFARTARKSIGLSGQKVEFSDRLGEVRQPTLIVWGRQDPIIPVAHGVRAARLIPNARLHVFERCGHMPLWEYPEDFVRLVLEFLG